MQCVKWVICGRHLLGRGRAGLMWVDLYSSEIGLNSLEFFIYSILFIKGKIFVIRSFI